MSKVFKDLMEDTSGSISDLASDEGMLEIAPNQASIRNTAAYAGLLSDDPEAGVQEYQDVSNKLNFGHSESEVPTSIDKAREQAITENKKLLEDVLLDPTIGDEDKSKAINTVMDPHNENYSKQNLLSQKELSKPQEHETARQEHISYSLAATVKQINQIKADKQRLYNQFMVRHNPTTGEKTVNLLSNLIPFAYQTKTSNLTNSFLKDQSFWDKLYNFILPGSGMKKVIEKLRMADPDKQVETLRRLLEVANSQSGIVSPNNAIAQEFVKNVVNRGEYSTADVWVDNVTSLADFAVGIGSLAKTGVKGAKAVKEAKELKKLGDTLIDAKKAGKAIKESGEGVVTVSPDEYHNMSRDISVKNPAQPTSPAANVSNFNHDDYRNIMNIVASDPSDEASMALTGTDRASALGDAILPEVGHTDDSVKAKVATPVYDLDDEIKNHITQDGYSSITQYEKKRNRALTVLNFQEAMGMENRGEMFQVHNFDSSNVSDGVRITAMYGPKTSGFSTPKEAVDTMLWYLRDLDISPEDLSIYQRVGDEYKKISLDEASKTRDAKGKFLPKLKDYLIGVDYKYSFDPNNIESWEKMSTKNNIFASAAPITDGKGGSLLDSFMAWTSVIDPKMYRPILAKTDSAAELESLLLARVGDFIKTTDKFSKKDKAVISNLIKKANHEGYEPTRAEILGLGLGERGVEAMGHWRHLWDNVWHLNNTDLAKTLKSRGYKKLVDSELDSMLFAKPIKNKANLKGSARVLDTKTNTIENLTKEQIDDLYKNGGTVAALKDPIDMGEEFAELVKVEGNVSNHLREIGRNDQVLHYRPGYYGVEYKGPYFIERTFPDKVGAKPLAVGTAKNRKEAEALVEKLKAASDDGASFNWRYDKNDPSNQSFETKWDLQNSSGRGSQRYRGLRLVDSVGNNLDPQMSHIVDPLQSATKAIRSMAKRTSVRDWLDVNKVRFMENHPDLLPLDEFEHGYFPTDVRQIAIQSGARVSQKELRDARTEFQYIRMIEEGYRNSLDDGIKAIFNSLADIMGNVHLTVGENAARALADVSITQQARKTTFGLYLGLNPARQLLVQSHQAVLLFPRNAGWFVSRAAPQTTYMIAKQMGVSDSKIPAAFYKAMGMTEKEAKEMFQHFKSSGLGSAVDKQNVVRGSLNDIADEMFDKYRGGKVRKYTVRSLKGVGRFVRKVGFDAGENFNIVTSWLAHRDLEIKAGKKMSDPEVRELVSAKARDFTGSMNSAGDVPWNKNSFGALLQFQQQTFKMFHLLTFNRGLTKTQKALMNTYVLIMWGIPTSLGSALYHAAFSEENTKEENKRNQHLIELADRGFESWLLNKTASLVFEDTDIDFSSLNVFDTYGTFTLMHNIWANGVDELLGSFPAGSLLFGGNPRLTNFVKTTAEFFGLKETADHEPQTFDRVVSDFLKLSSGMSNAFKAAYELEYHKAKSSYNHRVTDPDVNTAEAIAKVFGMPTHYSKERMILAQKAYEKSQSFEEDVNKWIKAYKDALRPYADGKSTRAEAEYIIKSHTEALRVFGNNPRARKIIDRNLRKDIANGDITFYRAAFKYAGMWDHADWTHYVLSSPELNERQKDTLLAWGKLYFQQDKDMKERLNKESDNGE